MHKEGLKFDEGKVRIELVPSEIIYAIAKILTFGAQKYDDRNWELGMKWSRVFGACMRHMWCWWAGKGPTTKNFVFGETDEETGYSHLWHAACCIAFLVTYEERQVGEDDRPHGNSNSEKKEIQATEGSCCMGEKTEETHVCCGRC